MNELIGAIGIITVLGIIMWVAFGMNENYNIKNKVK